VTEFNWDRMPVELRSKLLALAGMNASNATLKWSGFEVSEKEKLNDALRLKTNGTAVIGDR
jgi:hypothetical protein